MPAPRLALSHSAAPTPLGRSYTDVASLPGLCLHPHRRSRLRRGPHGKAVHLQLRLHGRGGNRLHPPHLRSDSWRQVLRSVHGCKRNLPLCVLLLISDREGTSLTISLSQASRTPSPGSRTTSVPFTSSDPRTLTLDPALRRRRAATSAILSSVSPSRSATSTSVPPVLALSDNRGLRPFSS